MAVCLEYQTIYYRRERASHNLRLQLIAALVLLLALGLKVWVRISITDRGYELGRQRDQTKVLERQKADLLLQLEYVTRPDEIRREARRRVGLIRATPEQMIKLQESAY